jgi:hypothetical protein
MSYEVACPSGLVFTARKLQVSEMLELAEAAEARAVDGGLTRVLSAVWQDLVSPGPYPFQSGAKPGNWDPFLEGDVLSALRRIRIESLGPDVEMNFKCEHCERQQDDPIVVDISLLEERPYPEESTSAHASGQRFSLTLSTKEVIEYQLNTIGGHRRTQQIKQQYRERLRKSGDSRAAKAMRPAAYDILLQCVTKVPSLGDAIRDASRFIEWCSALSAGDFDAITNAIEDRVGGLETKIPAECAFCDWRQEHLHLPLVGAFWRRSRRPKISAATPEETTTADSSPPLPTTP